MRSRGWRGVLGCLLLWGLSGGVRAADTTAAGWELLAGYQFREAYEAFTQKPLSPSRARVLGEAASLLNHSPVTDGKIEQAGELLRQLVTENGADDTALYARYLLARIAQVHRPAEVTVIETAYRAVIDANPAHPLAQLAAGKLALVLLYQRPELSVPQRLDAAAGLEKIAGTALLPEAACAYYRALAGAALFYGVTDERVLTWLQQADAIGAQDVLVTASLRIQLAEVARTLGHRQEALHYYQRFLQSILPTDNRYLTAKERMQELEATP
ncbi:MAG: hypothetical protein KA257_01805 [Opitutaceae bacterium]|nr:hypothetical protein [Opitutaceae bacterium]MBP9911944.1 hypothetical protein [Opitutaceae bacterium]